LNPLLGRWREEPRGAGEAREALRTLADRYRSSGQLPWATTELPGDELLAHFGRAGAEGLRLMADLLGPKRAFSLETVPAEPARPPATVLSRLQDQLLGRDTPDASLPQDTSLQIAACPGIYREVETVYQSILHNLQQDSTLRQNDIAVLATDMARYRPVVQAVFERQPRRLAFTTADTTAAGWSAFGHAALGLLDLALESFTRSRVFNVLLNPCFLARLGVDHEQALTWLDWAEALGVYHAWDRSDKVERGYPDSGLYSWQLGLQRLRLGRLMDAAGDDPDQPAPRCQEVIPFADLHASDKEQLDAFCRAVEGLLPRLAELRGLQTSGKAWAAELTRLLADFLTVPADRPEEQRVHDRLLRALETLPTLDQLHTGREPPALPLSLVREFVEHNLEARQPSSGDSLTCVTIAGLATLRALPFRIIYIMGLGEGLFPGTNPRSAFDLRSREPLPGDVKPIDANRFLFLEALLAARSKLYLLYPCRELQRDQELHPCGPLNQVRRHLEQHLLGGEKFQVVPVPLRGDDLRCLQASADTPHTDLLVNYNESERLLALARAQESRDLRLDERQARELDERLDHGRRGFRAGATEVAAAAARPESIPPTVSLRDLSGFLSCPVEAGLRRHLRLRDDEEVVPADDEPFSTEFPLDFRLVSEFLHRFVARSVRQSVDAALADWRRRFSELHDEWRLRGWVPEDAFGAVDQARFLHRLEERIEGAAGLATFLRNRAAAEFVGPVLLGEYPTPVGPRARFPALRLALPAAGDAVSTEARLTGLLDYVWRSDQSLDALILTNAASRKVRSDHLSKPMLEPLLFFLALKAGVEARAGGGASQDWLGQRAFHLHIARDEGLVTFEYRPEDITTADAHAYLTELVRDFLDRSRFDLLPFDLLAVETKDRLRQAYLLADDDPKLKRLAANYATMFQETVDEDQEQPGFAVYRPMKLLEIVEARVPDEALALVRRRFRLLDRGPARARRAAGEANDDGV
jgi:exonuclease V gamma subunit